MSENVLTPVNQHDIKPKALILRAARCGAELIFMPRQTLMIRRGASSWHCADPHAAFVVLRGLEASAQHRQEGVAA